MKPFACLFAPLRISLSAAIGAVLFGGLLTVGAQTHPRLFFGPDDVAALRSKAQGAPHSEMLARMIANIHSVDYNQRGGNIAAAYLLTGDETYARMAALRAVDYISNTDRWANSSAWGLRRGIDMIAVAHLFDFCYNSTTWADFVVPATLEPETFVINGVTTHIPGSGAAKSADNFWHTTYVPRTVTVPSHYVGLPLCQAVSLALKLNADSLMASGGGSWPGNDKTGNNWHAVRYSSAALGYLLCNEAGVSTPLNNAINNLKTYLTATLGSSPAGMGWSSEGVAYAQFPGWFTYPFAIALKRNTGRDLVSEHPAMRYALWSTYMGALPVQRNSRLGPGLGIRPDFDDDHNVWEGEGTGALAFAFAFNNNPADSIPDFDYRAGLKWMFRRISGDLGDRQWDSASGNGIYAFLYYPGDIPEQNPDQVWGRTYYDPTYGAVMFRSGHQDADFSPFSGGQFTTASTDFVFQTTANTRSEVGGHGGPDDLTFRLIGLGVPWAVGSGRVWDAKGQTALFPYDPESSAANPATEWDTAVTDVFLRNNTGDGYAVLRADTTSTGVSKLSRRMVVDYSGRSGAPAFFVISDSCSNPEPWWRQQTLSTNTVDVSTPGQFVITSPEGHRFLGKILWPAGAQARTGTFQRGNEYFYKTQNIIQNRWVDFKSGADGHVLVALAVVPAGQPLPTISATGNPSGGFTITAGTAQFGLSGDTITSPQWNPPGVAITSPADGQAFVSAAGNATIPISGNAWDGDGTVRKIEVFLDDELKHSLAFDAASLNYGPVQLTGVSLGSHTVKVIATDNAGDTRSATALVRVTRSVPPAVEITHPSAATPLLTGQSLTIRGRVNDADDAINRVEVWFESANQNPALTKLGNAVLDSATGTWSFVWNNLRVGRGTIHAVAFDASGEQTSTPVILVKPALPFAADPLAGDAANYSIIRGIGADYRWSVVNDGGNLVLRTRPLTNNDYNNYRTFLAETNLQNYPDFEVSWRAKVITPLANNPQYFLNFGSEMFLDLQKINGVEKANDWTNANKGTRVWLLTPSYRSEVAWGKNLHRITDSGYPNNPGTDRAGIPDSGWNNLKARRIGKNLKVWANDVLILDGTDNTIGTRGLVGFGSERNTGSELFIDDVGFTPLYPDGTSAADQSAILAFSAPADLAQIAAGSAVTLQGSASDADGLAALALYRGSEKVSDLPTSGTWDHTWTAPARGFYTFHLEATDARGFVTRSAPRRVTVAASSGAGGNLPPTVTIGQNSAVAAPNFGLTGAVADSDGTIATVQIYRDGGLLGPAAINGTAWTFTVSGLASGNYTFTARAIDNHGAATEASFSGEVDGNAPPAISSVANVTTPQGTAPGLVNFTVGDDTTPATDLLVSAANSNAALVPSAGLTLGGTGANRTLAIEPSVGASGSSIITLTVTDGGNKTASSLFTFTVSAPPVATGILVSPASIGVAPTADAQFTASLVDQFGAPMPSQPAITWSVSGGGNISQSGLFTAGTVLGGPHTVTASGSGFSGTASVTVAGSIPTGRTVVNWTGNYVSTSQGFHRTVTTGNGVDLDGDGQADDAHQTIPFNTATPLNPSANYELANPSARFFGGVSNRAFNATSAAVFSDAFVREAAAADYFGFRSQGPSQTSAAYVWLKPDFLDGGHDSAARIVFSSESQMRVTVGGGKWDNIGAARWLVRQAGQWYVSETPLAAGTGQKTLEFAGDFDDGKWAAVDLEGAPHVNLDLGATGYQTRDFTDIDAFGIYLEADTLNGARFWHYIAEFLVDASVIADSEPAAISVTPASASLDAGAQATFTATLLDQYGAAVDAQPAFTWSLDGGGAITSAGVLTASETPGGPFTVTAAAAGFSGSASFSITAPEVGPVVAYAGAAGVEEFQDVLELSDGTVLVAGSAENLDWITANKTQLAPLSIPNRSTGRTAFVLRLAGNLQTVLGAWHLPAGQAHGFRWIKTTSKPGEPTGAVYVSGSCDTTSGDYFIARLDNNFIAGNPSALTWVLVAKASGAYGENLGLQPWDAGGDGRVAYLHESGGALRVLFADASGQPLKLDGLRGSHWAAGAAVDEANRQAGLGSELPATAVSGISFPADLRSWSDADRLAVFPDGNGEIKRGTWPLDLFTTVQDKNGGTGGVIEYGYTGYKSAGKFRAPGVAIDRDTNDVFLGFNIQSKFWDAPANKEQPDFEPAVIAYSGDGSLKWWSRLYHEAIDANENGAVDAGETRLSSPDQYVDGLAIDYSATPARLVVNARCHGNNAVNFWKGNAVSANPGGAGFQNQFTGTEGNIHIGWIGKLRTTDGRLERATYLSGYQRATTLTQTPYSDPNLDGWPSHNAGWPDLTTTRTETGGVRTDAQGCVYLVGVGPRMVTTGNALQKLPKITASLNEGISPWAAFARVFDSDLVTLAYSSALTGVWTVPSPGAEPEGANNTDLLGIFPTESGLLTVGRHRATSGIPDGNPVPVTAVPGWGAGAPDNTSALFARLTFSGSAGVSTAPVIVDGPHVDPSPVVGTSATLITSASDPDDAGANLVYSWSTLSAPAGGNATFAVNGSNAASSTTVTFTRAGAYTLKVVVSDPDNQTTQGTVAVTVQAVATALAISPVSAEVPTGTPLQFSATVTDQFGQALSEQTLTWAVAGGGSISGNGLFTAGGAPGGPHTVEATLGSLAASAGVTVTEAVVPDIALSHASLAQSAQSGSFTERPLRLSNAGTANLSWNATATVQNSGEAGEITCFTTSAQGGGPAYAWIDISGNGTTLFQPSSGETVFKNSAMLTFPSGFTFPYFGGNFSSVRVDTYGFLSFNTNDSGLGMTNSALPTSDTQVPPNIIAVLWRQFMLDSISWVKWRRTATDTLVITWHNVYANNNTSQRSTFQVILKSSGEILVQIKSHSATDRVYTVGVMNGNRTLGVTATHNPATDFFPTGTASNFAIRMTPGGGVPAWLAVLPSSGSVLPAGAVQIDIGFDSAGLDTGTYNGTITISSNDPDEPVIAVPVTLAVGTSPVSPNAPSVLAAHALSANSVDLSWTREGGSPTGHRADFRVVGAGAWNPGPAFGALDSAGTVTGLSAGTGYEFRIVATNAAGDSPASNTAYATTPGGYASWIAAQSGVGSLTAATNDPDGDSLPNLIEYALDTLPGNASSGTLPTLGEIGDQLTLTFTPKVTDGLRYFVEASSDLSDWSDQTDLTNLLISGAPYTHIEPAALTIRTRRFLRLRVGIAP